MYILKNKKVYFILLSIFFVAFLIRLASLPLPAFITQHISNFGITGGLFLLAGYKEILIKGFTKRMLYIDLAIFALINVVIEIFINAGDLRLGAVTFVDFNTADPVDMIFGLAAVALLYFAITKYSVKKSK